MKGTAFFISFMMLGIACLALSLVILTNQAAHSARRAILADVEDLKDACYSANDFLQEYGRARDCTAYEKVEDVIQEHRKR